MPTWGTLLLLLSDGPAAVVLGPMLRTQTVSEAPARLTESAMPARGTVSEGPARTAVLVPDA